MSDIDKSMFRCAKRVLNNQFLHKTFYFRKGTNPKYCILMEKPGKYLKNENEKEELEKLISVNTPIGNYLDIYIKYLIKWILHDNTKKPFFEPFFEKVLQKNLNSNFNKTFLNNNILKDFYFSDIIKYRSKYVKDNKIKVNKDSVNLFRKEIIILSNIQLIFIFGNVAFKNLIKYKTKYIKIVKVENNNIDSNRDDMISELHGSLYTWNLSDTRKVFIIPLIHMSPRSFNVTIRDTYFDYLNKGLTKYRKIANMKK
jgi:uracil-DNA glycosylase